MTRGRIAAIAAGGLIALGLAGSGGAALASGHGQPARTAPVTASPPAKPVPAAHPRAHHAPHRAASPAPARTTPAALPVLQAAGFDGIRPAFISFSGDGGNVITRIAWSSWGPEAAYGSGTSYLQGCVPNCAEGSTTPVTATVTLTAPAAGRFTWITEVRNGQASSGPVSQITGAQQYSPAPPPVPAPASTPLPVTDPQPGSGTGTACTSIAGYYPGGLPGHQDSTGFCVPDRTGAGA